MYLTGYLHLNFYPGVHLRRLAVLAATVVTSLAFAASASADYSQVRISEVHAGAGGVGDYVELQIPAGVTGGNLLSAHYIYTYSSGNPPYSETMIPANVTNGNEERTILISDGMGTLPGGVVPDMTAATLNVATTGGEVCLMDTPTVGIDCVAYGTIAKPTPEPSPSGNILGFGGSVLNPGETLVRNISSGCATLFELSDDTDDSASDFAIGTPSPRNNTTAPTEKACTGTENPPVTDTTPPNTKFKAKPPKATVDTTPKFKFSSTESGSTFQCRIDGKKFRKCTSPFTPKRLKPGKHTLRVRAIDVAGNVDKTPAKYKFRVVKPLP